MTSPLPTLLKAATLLGFLTLFWACETPEETKTQDAAPTKVAKVDTTVHSIPVNYLETISDSTHLEINSYKELLTFWESEDYTYAAWKSGVREIPRAFLINIPHAWRAEVAPEITVNEKKLIFFRGMAPLVLRANELILMDRSRLLTIKNAIGKNETISQIDQAWASSLAKLYRTEIDWQGDFLGDTSALLKRVNIIPESLALAQAAIESGWGTSRFAEEGNSIFGQWAWGKDAIKPKEQRSGMGNYGIQSFASLQASVCAYMLNINTHNAYESLRNKRLELEKEKQKLTGFILCEELNKYSERGEAYVVDLKNMMTYNHLAATDDAYFSDAASVYLVPAGH